MKYEKEMVTDKIFKAPGDMTPHIECMLCGECYSMTALKDGTLDINADKCPKCPKE
jgi:hypothetical protein